MDIEFPAIIFSAVLIGWLLGRFSSSSKNSKTNINADLSNCSESYIQGLNYLLANKSDKAIELFVDLIKVDKETMETHLALGNLFRSKGEVDRAIKIHQNLIARPNLDQNQRVMALSELAEDYLKAGLLDRAENLFKELVQINPKNNSALRKLLELFTLEKSWSEALTIAKELHKLGEVDSQITASHCYCEIAQQYLDDGNLKDARESLKKAIQFDDKCIRAQLLLIDIHLKDNEIAKATRLLKQLIKSSPQFIELFIKPAREIYLTRGSIDQYQEFLINQYEFTHANSVALELLESYQSSDKHEMLVKFLHKATEHSASLGIYNFAFRYLESRPQKLNEVWMGLSSQFQGLNNNQISFICNVCGYESKAMQWNCPSCKTWSSFKPV